MAVVKKTIGFTFRDYPTVTVWESFLDEIPTYINGDTAIGECYDDTPFDESPVIDGGTTVGLVRVELTAAIGQKHTGLAGTGVRFNANAVILKITWNFGGVGRSGLISWIEVNNNALLNTSFNRVFLLNNDNVNAENCIVHGGIHNRNFNTFVAYALSGTTKVLNCVAYNMKSQIAGGSCIGFQDTKISETTLLLNCTAHNITAVDASAKGFDVNSTGTRTVINCVATDCDTDFSVAPTGTTFDHCLSSDTTAIGLGSLPSKLSSVQYQNNLEGSEDLHLKNAADAIDAGSILGTSPAGVEMSMPPLPILGFEEGLDRSLSPQGTSTDMGAYEFLASQSGDPGLLVMAVTDDMTSINPAEVVTDWTAGNNTSAQAIDADIKVQGLSSIVCRVNGITTPSGLMYDNTTVLDLSNKHLYVWGFTMHKTDTKGLGGWRIRVSPDVDGLTNYGEWYVGGNDSVIGANQNFQIFVIDTNKAFDNSAGTGAVITSIQSVGLVSKFLTSNGRLSFYVDDLKYGTGAFIKDGRDANPGTFSAVALDDKAQGRGVLTSAGGIFYCTGKLEIGNDVSGGHVFVDSNFVLAFEDMPVGINFYQLTFVSNSTGFGICKFGVLIGSGSGAIGSGGGFFKSLGPRFVVDIVDSTFNQVHLYGSTFVGAGQTTVSHAGVQMVSTSFDDCDSLNVSGGAQIINCSISNAVNIAVTLTQNPASGSFVGNKIQNSAIGLSVPATITGGILVLDNILFNGNTNDIEVTGAGSLTIQVINGGSVPQNILKPGGATVTVTNLVNFTLSNLVPGSQIYVAALAGGPLVAGTAIFGPVSGLLDLFSTVFDYSSDQPIRGTVALGTLAPFYKPYSFTGTVTVNGFTLSTAQELDQ